MNTLISNTYLKVLETIPSHSNCPQNELQDVMQQLDLEFLTLFFPKICATVPARGEGSASIAIFRNQGLLI